MKRIIIAITFLFISVRVSRADWRGSFDDTYFAPEEEEATPTYFTWYELIGLPLAISVASAAWYDGHLYCIGGQNSSYTYLTNVYRLDATEWVEVEGIPVAGLGKMSTQWGSLLYTMGGGTPFTNVYTFDGSTWSVGNPLQGIGALNYDDSRGVYIDDGWMYLHSGYQITNLFKYNGTSTVELVGIPDGKTQWGGGGGIIDGIRYVAPGNNKTNFYKWVASAWVATPGLPVQNRNWTMLSVADKIFLSGSQNGSTSVFCFDGISWQHTNACPLGRAWLQGTCSDGTSLYYVGGAVGGSYGRTNVYRFGP